MTFQLVALRGKPNQEEVLWCEILARGVEVFYSQLACSSAARKIELLGKSISIFD